jgi:hypothetical protein
VDGGADNWLPVEIRSDSTLATAMLITNTSSGGRQWRIADTGQDYNPGWLLFTDMSAPMTAFALRGDPNNAQFMLPSVGTFEWASGSNLPLDPVDVALQRSAAGQLQVSDGAGNDRDLRARSLTVSGNVQMAGAPQTWTPNIVPGGSMTITTQSITYGRWMRFGPFCFCTCRFTVKFGGTMSNVFTINNPPVAPQTWTGIRHPCTLVVGKPSWTPAAAWIDGSGFALIPETSGTTMSSTLTYECLLYAIYFC